jgi:hypothetical protein
MHEPKFVETINYSYKNFLQMVSNFIKIFVKCSCEKLLIVLGEKP